MPDATRSRFLRRMKAVGGLTPSEGYRAAVARRATPRHPRRRRAQAVASPGTSSMAGSRLG